MKLLKSLIISAVLTAFASSAFAQANGPISGQVVDTLGASVVGATVTAVTADGKQKQAISNARGEYSIPALAPGKYTVKAIAPNFALYENAEVEVAAGQGNELSIVLTVTGVEENVEVSPGGTVNTEADNNANATVLSGKDLEALPDDPDELEAALQALAGASAGPDGGQINIDGFTGGRLPPKEAIREIRINTNPFSAEYERIGFGRIDVLTRPGFDKFRGSANFNFNDESLNSRNPFAANRAPSQLRSFGGFLSGPIQSKKSSFFVDVNQTARDENSVIAATILDQGLNIVNFQQDVTVPTRRLSISPRIDYAINDKNTLVGRYSFQRNTSENQQVGGFSLPSQATVGESTQNQLNLTHSLIVNARTVNETRFQFERTNRSQTGNDTTPTIIVSNAFTGGGTQIGDSFNRSNRWELQNYTTTTFGKGGEHGVKFGVRIRGISLTDRSENGYGGAFTFSGFVDNNGTPTNPDDDFFVSSINQFRQKVLGNPDPRYNPNQFSLTTGNPLANVSQVDFGLFFTDDWKLRQDLTLSFGLRYENQTNMSDNFNLAPRFGFAYSPGAGGARQPKTVIRGGFGVFFDRFNENNTLRARRQDGVSQPQFLVTSNTNNILGQAVFTPTGVSNVPTAAQLASVTPLASIPFRVAEDLKSPYSMQTALSVERQITPKTVFSATFTATRSLHNLRTRNINAPVCPTVAACPAGLNSAQIQARRPNPAAGNIYQVESSGSANAQMLLFNMRSTLGKRITLNGGYTLSFAKGDTDSLTRPGFNASSIGYPAYSYDLSDEFAPSAFNARHSVFFVGGASLPLGFRVNSIIIASSGRRYNIRSGVDTNYDSVFFERPTFSALADRCRVLALSDSFCDIAGVANPDNTVIPRNYGLGPGNFVVNLNVTKTFGFGGGSDRSAKTTGDAGQGGSDRGGNRGGRGGGRSPGGPMGGGGGRGPGGPMGGGMFGGGDNRKPYNLTFGLNVQNLFNTVNLAQPVSTLSSPTFGRARSTGGGFGFFGGGGGGGGGGGSANRRIDLSVRFTF